MQVAFIILCVISLILVAAAVVIFIGKGDDMIVGYNISSKKTRDHFHQKRVRIIVGTLLILIAVALPVFATLLTLGYKELAMTVFPPVAFVLIAGTFAMVHLWAKKK